MTTIAMLRATHSAHDLEIAAGVYGFIYFKVTETFSEKASTATSRQEISPGDDLGTRSAELSGDYDNMRQIERNKSLIALLDAWLQEVPFEADADLDQQKRDLENSRNATYPVFQWPNH